VTSFINIRYGNVPLKSSHKEHWNSLLLFVCCGQKDFVQMSFSPRCVQYMVSSILQDQQYMFGVKRLLMGEKVLLMQNLVTVLFRRPMQRYQRSIPSCGQTGVWWDECLHEFGRYVEKWNINVWRWNTFACWICSLFSQLIMLFNNASCKRKLLGKILHWLTAF